MSEREVGFRENLSMKLIVHLVILGLLLGVTIVSWKGSQEAAEKAEQLAEERAISGEVDFLDSFGTSRDSADAMIKVGLPLLATVIYAGVLTIIYVLPTVVDHVSEELIGSSERVGDDPRIKARAAIENEDYPEAIRIYREMWKEDPDDRFPMVEIANLQRRELENPILAVDTLKEAYEDHGWPEGEAAFLLNRMVEIYQDDLDDEKEARKVMERIIEDLPGTRFAVNAKHELKKLG